MSIYRYKFESVLKYRKSTENNKKNLLNLSIKKHIEEKKGLYRLYDNLYESYESMKREFNNGIKIEEIANVAEWQSFYREEIKKKTVSVENAKNNVKSKRLELISAMQDRKIMEKLKEIDFNNYKYEEQRKIEKSLDEIISFKSNSKMMEGK